MNMERKYDEESLQHMYALLQKHDIETIFRMALEVTQSRMLLFPHTYRKVHFELTCGRSNFHNHFRLPILTHVIRVSLLGFQHRLCAISAIFRLFSLKICA